ncbi:MAG: alpha/beta fold hydrolase [Flexilinea sp.]|nr:alpha/beta fold hydrolase [Flexilinea sp.]
MKYIKMCLVLLMAFGLFFTKHASAQYRIEERTFSRAGMRIYGELYLPEGEGPFALVILSHGFGGNHTNLTAYAELFADNGIAAYVYDFIGGGYDIRSDGSMTKMSVLTEAADLNSVIDGLRASSEIDPDKIFLVGASQGGFVSTYVAGTRPDDIAGLIALYPAYVLQDDARSQTPDPENIPETFSIMGITVGRIYSADALSFDIYEVMKNYPGKVQIQHGTSDSISPISYSERAVTVFPDAELITYQGAGHGFRGNTESQSAGAALDFVQSILKRNESGKEVSMKLQINDTPVTVDWEENESVEALKKLAESGSLTISMSPYGGFEQVGPVGQSLPRNDVQTVTGPGDIVLYSGNQIVIFYGSNSWAYTRLGHVTDKNTEELTWLLNSGPVTLTFSLK